MAAFGYDDCMSTVATPLRGQFSLRSLLGAVVWLALLLAICVQYHRASALQREMIDRLKAGGVLPPTTVAGRPLPSTGAAGASAQAIEPVDAPVPAAESAP